MEILEGIYEKLSNIDYHANKTHLSSSNLKDILKEPKKFYDHKILNKAGQIGDKTQLVFDEGNYAHSLLLEPENIKKEYRFFDGWRKQGADWEVFKEANKDFIILSKPQKVRVEKWASEAKKLNIVNELLSGGKPEVSVFGNLFDMPLKARADYINVNKRYIVDVKTTSFPPDYEGFKYTALQGRDYHLSAALYMMLFEAYYKCPFEFYFIVLGKSTNTCEVYKLGKDSRMLGESLVLNSVKMYKQYVANNWNLDILTHTGLESAGDYEVLEI